MISKMNCSRTGMPLKILLCVIFLSALIQAPFLCDAVTAHADGGLKISTEFPDISVKSGSDHTFRMNVKNDTGADQNIDISVAVPDGWTYVLYGGGNEVYKVYVPSGTSQDVNFVVTIPQAVNQGKYQISFTGTGSGCSDTSVINLDVTPVEIKQGTWTSSSPEMKGANTDTFQFMTSLKNESMVDQAYSLSTDAKAGWKVEFLPQNSSQAIASCTVEPGGTLGLDINITPAYNVTPGDYTVTCSATSAQGTLTLGLKVQITGAYKMIITTPSGALNADAYPGKQTALTLLIKNTGSSDISNISLMGQAASNWKVTFESATIASIPAGQSKEVKAYITADSNSLVGDYVIGVTASASGVSAQSAFRVAVKSSTLWGIFGIILILLLVAGLMVVFMKFGRR